MWSVMCGACHGLLCSDGKAHRPADAGEALSFDTKAAASLAARSYNWLVLDQVNQHYCPSCRASSLSERARAALRVWLVGQDAGPSIELLCEVGSVQLRQSSTPGLVEIIDSDGVLVDFFSAAAMLDAAREKLAELNEHPKLSLKPRAS